MNAPRNVILFVAPNSFVIRNWIASGLADLCEEMLGLTPEFATHFSDPTVTSPKGSRFRNYFVPTARQRGSSNLPSWASGLEIPDGFPRLLYWLYYLRLRTAALDIEDGSLQLINLARRRDLVHYLVQIARALFPLGSGRRTFIRRIIDSISPRHELSAEVIEKANPRCVVVGSPGFLFFDQPMIIEAQRRGIPVYCVVNSWDNMTSRGAMIRRPDLLMVWNEHMREQAFRFHQYPLEKTHAVGALQFRPYGWPVSREELTALYERLGLPFGSPYLLLATHAHAVDYEAEDVVALLEALKASPWADLPFVIRVHPQADEKPFRAIDHPKVIIDRRPEYAAAGDRALSFDLSEIRSMAALLQGASVVFSSWGTTALLEAAIFDRPIVQLRWMDAFPRRYPEQVRKIRDFQRYYHMKEFDRTGCRVFSDHPKTIVADIARLFDDAEGFRARRRHAVESFTSPPFDEVPLRVIKQLQRALNVGGAEQRSEEASRQPAEATKVM